MILIFGDSHTSAFSIDNDVEFMIPDEKLIKKDVFSSYRTLPYTCYNIYNKKELICNFLKTITINHDDIVFFSYGETDIRCHIGFNIVNNNEDEIIHNVVINYIKLLIYIKSKFNFKVGCYFPIASGIYNGVNGNGRNSFKNDIERNKLTLKFNEKLQKECIKYNILYKDISKKLMDENLQTKNDYYCDGLHLGIKSKQILLDEFRDIIEKYVSNNMIITFIGNCQTMALCYFFQQLLAKDNYDIYWVLYGSSFGYNNTTSVWSNKCKNQILNDNISRDIISKSDIIIYQEIDLSKSLFSNYNTLKTMVKGECRLIKIPSIYLIYENYDNSIKELQKREDKNNVDIKVSQIFDKYKYKKLVQSDPSHPTTFLFLEILKELCTILKFDYFTKDQEAFFLQNDNHFGLPNT
jgi:hypothetical protein